VHIVYEQHRALFYTSTVHVPIGGEHGGKFDKLGQALFCIGVEALFSWHGGAKRRPRLALELAYHVEHFVGDVTAHHMIASY
jgi:hypothetical protein